MTTQAHGSGPASSPFERHSPRDVLDLIDAYPLAWIVPSSGLAPPGLLPLLAETDADGRLVSLLGHMGRRNPLCAAFAADDRATILFTGPQASLSTALVSDPHWAPTWAYAQASIVAALRFVPDETEAAVARLTVRMEGAAGTGWEPRRVGDRYGRMMATIVAFRASVTAVHARFKLGQDETPERLREILAGIGDPDLARWIERFNADRRP